MMSRSSISLAILILGVIITQGGSSNSNINTNSFTRRSGSNLNTNTNSFGRQADFSSETRDFEAELRASKKRTRAADDIVRYLSQYRVFEVPIEIGEILGEVYDAFVRSMDGTRRSNTNSNSNYFGGAPPKLARPDDESLMRSDDYDGIEVIRASGAGRQKHRSSGASGNTNRNTNTFGSVPGSRRSFKGQQNVNTNTNRFAGPMDMDPSRRSMGENRNVNSNTFGG